MITYRSIPDTPEVISLRSLLKFSDAISAGFRPRRLRVVMSQARCDNLIQW